MSTRVLDPKSVERTAPSAARGDRRIRPAVARPWAALFAPVDVAGIVVFRAVFGAVMVWEMWRYWSLGWIGEYYVEPTFHFTYLGFGWVRPLPEAGMYSLFALLALCGAGIALGARYRLCAGLFFLGYSYVFLLEQATFNNHYYLIALIALLLTLVPAHRAWSLDARRRPGWRSETVPGWALWTLRGIVAIPYLYGALAKLKADWFRGQPMELWLAERGDLPMVGRVFTADWAPSLFSWGGFALDLLVVPALLWPRTRSVAFVAATLFHVTNAWLFPIGVFPPLMIAATTILLPSSWPRAVGLLPNRRPPTPPAGPPPAWAALGASQRLTLAFLACFFAAQLLLPLRHVLLPGHVSWTEEGFRFAWHMRLRDKWGEATFVVTDPATGATERVDPDDELRSFRYLEMASKPDMILQYAHHLADQRRRAGQAPVEVRAEVVASLNRRRAQPLVDPTVDLAAQPRTLGAAPWILPLTEPLDGSGPGGRS